MTTAHTLEQSRATCEPPPQQQVCARVGAKRVGGVALDGPRLLALAQALIH